MIYFVYGEDMYRVQERAGLFQERFLKVDPSRMNFFEYYPDTFSFSGFREAALAPPFMAKQRLLIVHSLGDLKKQDQDEIFDFLKEYTGTNVILIVWPNVPDKRRALVKWLLGHVKAQEFSLLEGVQLQRWIEQRAGSLELQLKEGLSSYLVTLFGSDLYRCSHELSKLKARVGDGVLTQEIVNSLCVSEFSSSIFDALDAMLSRNRSHALQLLHEQLSQGHHPLYVFTMIVTQFRQLLILSDIVASGTHSSTLAKEAGLHPFVVQKLQPHLQRFTPKLLSLIYSKCISMDHAIKTGDLSPIVALDLFILSLT